MAAVGAAFCALFFGGGEAQCAQYQPDLLIRLGSEPDSAYTSTASENPGSVTAQVKSQGVVQGVAAVYSIKVVNAGSSADSIRITGSASGSGYTVQYVEYVGQSVVDRTAGITAALGLSIDLNSGESRVFTLKVTPSAAPQALIYDVTVQAVSLNDGGKVDAVKASTCSVGNLAAVTLSSPPDLTGPPGSVVIYPYTVTNTGNVANTFALAVTGGWRGTLYADNGDGGGIPNDGAHQGGETHITASTEELAPGGTYRFFLAVTVPDTALNSDHSENAVTVTGTGSSVSDRVTTGAVAPGLTLVDSVRNITRGGVFATSAEAAPGETLEYRLAVTSSGAHPAGPVVVRSEVPANTTFLAGSLMISASPTAAGVGCSPATCGEAAESAGTITAYLGAGASAGSGGTIPVGQTLYLYFRVQLL